MHKRWLITVVAAFVMIYGINAKAGDGFTKGWTFEVTPYLWAARVPIFQTRSWWHRRFFFTCS